MSDEIAYRTYDPQIILYPGMETVLTVVGKYLGDARLQDFSYIEKAYHNGKKIPTEKDRKNNLKQYAPNLSTEHMRAIMAANDNQLNLSKRTHADNLYQWKLDYQKVTRDITKIRKENVKLAKTGKRLKPIPVKLNNKQQYLRKRLDQKFPTITIGGKKLFRKVVKGDELAKKQWAAKRRFIGCLGRANRAGGNDGVRITQNDEVEILVPIDVRQQLGATTARVIVGKVKYRYGEENIKHALLNRLSMTAHIEQRISKRKSKWFLILRTPIPADMVNDKQKKVYRVDLASGLDVNDGFLATTINDIHGCFRKAKTIGYSKDVNTTINNYLDWLEEHDVGVIFVENLKGLQRSITRKNAGLAALNRCVNNIPTGQLLRALLNQAKRRGMRVYQVNPHNTSKNVPLWDNTLPGGLSSHEKASHLICRRGLGLSIYKDTSRTGRKRRQLTRGSIGVSVTCYASICGSFGVHSPRPALGRRSLLATARKGKRAINQRV